SCAWECEVRQTARYAFQSQQEGDLGIKLTRDQTNSLAFKGRLSRFSPDLCQSRGQNRTTERPPQPQIAPVVGSKRAIGGTGVLNRRCLAREAYLSSRRAKYFVLARAHEPMPGGWRPQPEIGDGMSANICR